MAVPPCKPVRFLCECDDSCSLVGSQGLPEVLSGAAHIVPWDGDGDDGLRADERHALSVSAEVALIRGYFSQADTQLLDPSAHLSGSVDTGEAGHQMQRHVDSRGDARRSDHISIVDEPLVGADLESRVKLGERLQRAPVRGGGPVREQTGSREYQRAGADARHQWHLDTLLAHPVQL